MSNVIINKERPKSSLTPLAKRLLSCLIGLLLLIGAYAWPVYEVLKIFGVAGVLIAFFPMRRGIGA